MTQALQFFLDQLNGKYLNKTTLYKACKATFRINSLGFYNMLYSRFQDCFRTTADPCTSEKTLVAVLESEVLECHLQCSSILHWPAMGEMIHLLENTFIIGKLTLHTLVHQSLLHISTIDESSIREN